MSLEDLTTEVKALADADFNTLLNSMFAEQQRRQTLASTPSQITTAAQQFMAAGGDFATLTTALNAAQSTASPDTSTDTESTATATT